MREQMKYFEIYEKIMPVWGIEHTEFVGIVRAKTKEAAITRAANIFKVDRRGIPYRQRKPENFIAK